MLQLKPRKAEHGLSIMGLIIVAVVLGFFLLIIAKTIPAISEYQAVKNALKKVSHEGGTPAEMRAAFNKTADVTDIHSIKGEGLEIQGSGDNVTVRAKYEAKIELFGNVSLVLDFDTSAGAGGGGKLP
ncbi:DUF4845 domain-containing protein [Leeia aquatica]|uniref:DUF4845 domain-containing protein n=1 Tax=Leeia aquatica TaxID=2725557 RepID=A0A847SAI6_9NEIS|nr:DUF4845 domain-containing protein [Leeia aquatica]NLR74098.1 DUF4845 domain-containing protein [Leeia aquatica]